MGYLRLSLLPKCFPFFYLTSPNRGLACRRGKKSIGSTGKDGVDYLTLHCCYDRLTGDQVNFLNHTRKKKLKKKKIKPHKFDQLRFKHAKKLKKKRRNRTNLY